MTETASRSVESNQQGMHERLEVVVAKHLKHAFRRPIADHSRRIFDDILVQIKNHSCPLIIDACCGVGDSSRHFARQFPDHFVVGVDKSDNRLSRNRNEEDPSNMMLARTDLNDFYRLAVEANLRPLRHYILYPNPWPKAAHLKRRWHGAPVFPSIIALGGRLELRSNWDIYLREFQHALLLAGEKSEISIMSNVKPITPFEAKYMKSRQDLWRLIAAM